MSAQQHDGTSGTLGELGEFGVIGAITANLPHPPWVQVGPGDDAAVIDAPDSRVVVSTDVLVSGVHFRTDWGPGDQIGIRAARAAMADIAAMGAMPTGLVVALAAPSDTPGDLVTAIGRGIASAASEVGAALVGGDLTRSDQLSITVTVLGDLRGAAPVLRSGARAGDVVALAGRIGWAAAGFTVLSRGFRSPAAVVGAYRVPEPPLTAGPIAAAAGATAMIDISDGLIADLGHISVASEVAIDIHTESLVIAPRLVEVASALGKEPLHWLLTGGDDHALAATFPPDVELPAPWHPIGVVAGVPRPEGGEPASGETGIAELRSGEAGPELGQPADGVISRTDGPDGTILGWAAYGVPHVTVDGAPYEGEAGWEHFR